MAQLLRLSQVMSVGCSRITIHALKSNRLGPPTNRLSVIW